MISVAICDDEKNIRVYLSSLIRQQGIECNLTEYASCGEYLSNGEEHDILFLDIEMKGEHATDQNGMWLARQLRNRKLTKQPIIIFVTGYETYVYDAFDVGAFQFLLKPIEEQRFSEVFQRAVAQVLADAEKKKKVWIVPCANGRRTIPLADICYMESRDHKMVVNLLDEKVEYYAKIGEVEQELQGQFYRIHKGYLIHLLHVESYNKTEVTMANGDKLPISKYKYDDFIKAYMDYISEG